ncbi:MAG TPA: hypothetical protein VIF83_10710 [Gemmatimonadaceae bacterium]|jgi:apolipoprotein N-acyltransferase
MVIRHVAPLSAAKVFATIYAVVGLIVGAIFSWLSTTMGTFARDVGFMAPFVGVGAIIVLPILYACAGFIGTLIVATLYNVAAGIVGGVNIEFEQGTNVT